MGWQFGFPADQVGEKQRGVERLRGGARGCRTLRRHERVERQFDASGFGGV
jgi:hypothetical protein